MKIDKYLFLIICLLFSFKTIGADSYLRERLYLQTDKNLYLAGELIWLKLISTDNTGKPINISKVGYVELVDETSSQIQIKVELKDGVGEGWILLPTELPSANYRLVAYTKYMRNENEKIFFDKIIPVINTFVPDQLNTIKIDTLITNESNVNNNNNNNNKTISISTNRSLYGKRENGELKLNGIPENIHTLSVSIAGIDMVSFGTASNILEFSKQTGNLLPEFSFTYIPEYEGHMIKGKIIETSTGKPQTASNITPLLSYTGDKIRLFSGQFDENANVIFYTKGITGMEELVTKVLSPIDNQFRVDIESPFAELTYNHLHDLKWNPSWNENILRRSVGLQVFHAFMADTISHTYPTDPVFRIKPDRQYHLDEYTRFTTMEEVVVEIIPSIRFRRINNKRTMSVLMEEGSTYTVGNSLVMIDGVPVTDHEIIFRYDPLKIKTIDVHMGNYYFGGQMFTGIITMWTYSNDYPGLTLDNATQFFDYKGPVGQRYFYAPSYDTDIIRKSSIPDYRHTLLWLPHMKIKGESTTIVPFSTSDMNGEFKITVEGLTNDGQPVYAVSYIKVE